MNDVLTRALELFNDQSFRDGPCHEQGYDWEVYHKATKFTSYQRWLWNYASRMARLEKAIREGKSFTTEYFDIQLLNFHQARRLREDFVYNPTPSEMAMMDTAADYYRGY